MRSGIVADANEAVASVAYRQNEVIAIYPITPASPMGEHADEWASRGRKNVWGEVPLVVEMQSEGGAAGVVHGALQGGSLATSFTASQGLLLMIPNLYKIAGELTPMVLHVAARTVATHALSIFCDYSDVMACRQTGLMLLSSSSVQEAQDFACIAQAASLESRVPVLHFFDGFRTSHELVRIEPLTDDDLAYVLPRERVLELRKRALNPDHPVLRGTAQNPDTFFQAREAVNPHYQRAASAFASACQRFSERTGRRYSPFEYYGHPQAERVVVAMGSATHTLKSVVRALNARGERTGMIAVHLYRPFVSEGFEAREPIAAPYLIERADFVACHQHDFVNRSELAERLKPGATLLLNTPFAPDAIWRELPLEMQQQVLHKGATSLRDRRLRYCCACRAGTAHQHRHADRILLAHAARTARYRAGRHASGNRRELRAQGCRARAPEPRSDRGGAGGGSSGGGARESRRQAPASDGPRWAHRTSYGE